jgi:hypothetical protein
MYADRDSECDSVRGFLEVVMDHSKRNLIQYRSRHRFRLDDFQFAFGLSDTDYSLYRYGHRGWRDEHLYRGNNGLDAASATCLYAFSISDAHTERRLLDLVMDNGTRHLFFD